MNKLVAVMLIASIIAFFVDVYLIVDGFFECVAKGGVYVESVLTYECVGRK